MVPRLGQHLPVCVRSVSARVNLSRREMLCVVPPLEIMQFGPRPMIYNERLA